MNCKEFAKQHYHYNYCEIVISPEGDITYAIPSHLYRLIAITNKTNDEIYNIMPVNANPINWLCEYTNYCVCWFNECILSINYTSEQINAIKYLIRHNILSKNFKCHLIMEKTLCDLLSKFNETKDIKYLNEINDFKKSKDFYITYKDAMKRKKLKHENRSKNARFKEINFG